MGSIYKMVANGPQFLRFSRSNSSPIHSPFLAIVWFAERRSFESNQTKMAESSPQYDDVKQEQQHAERLKYLDFVQVATAQAVMCLASLYEFAKDNSGPLKAGVQAVEGTVKSVVGPVYDRLHDVPFEVLKFVDSKVENTVRELEKHVPALVKQTSCRAYSAAQKAPGAARSVAAEVHRSGVVATAAGMARAAYERYSPVGEKCAVTAWRSLNRMPLFPQVAGILVPTAAYWSEKYNRTVGCAAERGYAVAEYLPLVPTERIAKVFGSDAQARNRVVGKEVPIEAAE